jgi:anti-sigma-K factor RskA
VLSAEERRAVERRLASEPALAREVIYWEERLGGLADGVAPVAPPAHVWDRVEGALAAPAQGAATRSSVWNSLTFWRGLGIATSGLAAACIALLVYVGITAQRVPLMATLTQPQSGQPGFVATVSADGRSVNVVPAALLTADQRAFELWLITPDAPNRPRSLGLIQPGRPISLTVPPDLAGRVRGEATLAVSVEPPGGSPTGAPTGPVVAVGKLTNL